MANTAVVGINWGDEGKGRMVDSFAGKYDIVIRAQGGSNAGHTVITEAGRFALNLLPAGIFTPGVVCVLGCGVAIDIKHLAGEIDRVTRAGAVVTPDNLKIDRRALMVLPVHKAQDRWEESRLGNDASGSTLRGIGPAYSDGHLMKGIPVGLLDKPEVLKKRVKKLVDFKNAVYVKGYGVHRIDLDETLEWIEQYKAAVLPYLADVGEYLKGAVRCGKSILFEGQSGALCDISYGCYPYGVPSTTLASGIPLGSGLPTVKIDRVIGVAKAYATCGGRGSFVGELEALEAEILREAGGEYGAATGRPRRVAWFDCVASREGVELQGADEIALTKLDVLSTLDQIPVCIAYLKGGEMLTELPAGEELAGCEPVYEVLPGWKRDISCCRRYQELPDEARAYVEFIEKEIRCPIRYVSIGTEEDQLLTR